MQETRKWFLLTDTDSTGATEGYNPYLFQIGGDECFRSEKITSKSY